VSCAFYGSHGLIFSQDISIDGDTAVAFTENVALRFKAYGWAVHHVDNGDRYHSSCSGILNRIDMFLQVISKAFLMPLLKLAKSRTNPRLSD
jgi:hypothetical protein